jgi:hypothetical protein
MPYNAKYNSVVNLLSGDAGFRWNNLSVPKEAPLETSPLLSKSHRYLVRQIDQRIKKR